MRAAEQEKQAIIGWLCPLDFLQTQSDIFARHEVGTGRWFLNSSEFTRWVAGNDRTLWCPGDRKQADDGARGSILTWDSGGWQDIPRVRKASTVSGAKIP
jgi:hypothetical protein